MPHENENPFQQGCQARHGPRLLVRDRIGCHKKTVERVIVPRRSVGFLRQVNTQARQGDPPAISRLRTPYTLVSLETHPVP